MRDAANSAVLAVTAVVALGWAGQHVWGWVQDRLEDSRAEAPEMRRRRLMIRWLRHHLPVAELVDWLDSGLLGGAMRGLFLPDYSAIFERELRQAIPGGKAAAGCVFATGIGVWAAGRAVLLETRFSPHLSSATVPTGCEQARASSSHSRCRSHGVAAGDHLHPSRAWLAPWVGGAGPLCPRCARLASSLHSGPGPCLGKSITSKTGCLWDLRVPGFSIAS